MRRLAAALLSALLAVAGMPVLGSSVACRSHGSSSLPAAGAAATAHHHGAGCRMSCCVVRPAAASCGCRCGSGQVPRQASFAAGMPLVLPAPPRLPLPRSAALYGRPPAILVALPFLGLPERPPRA